MEAMLHALRHRGMTTVTDSLDCDAAMIWSVLWKGRMAANRGVYDHSRAQGRPVIVIDIGSLRRGHTWKVCVNNVNAQGYYGHRENLDPDRPRKLGISLAAEAGTKPSILVAAQHSASLQWQHQPSMEDWIRSKISEIRQHTDRPIVVRPHPRCSVGFQPNDNSITIQRPVKVTDTYDSFDLDVTHHAVINHNSGPGIRAALHCRPIVVDQTSLAWPVSLSMEHIENPKPIDRQQWLVEICHTEYTLQELAQGHWISRVSPALC